MGFSVTDSNRNKTTYSENFSTNFSSNNYAINNYTRFSIFDINKPGALSSFGTRSQSLMYKIPHKTRLLNIAQDYVGKIIEATNEELNKMTYKQKQNTQLAVIQYYGNSEDAWCVHTVSTICKLAGINIDGHKRSVQDFIDWGTEKGYYKPIKTNTMSSINYIQERKERAAQIKKQTKQMKEGDLIIWKSDTMYSTQAGFKNSKASHVGILESVNLDGTMTLIEGNANELRQDDKYERYLVTNKKEGINGNQEIGEFQEINLRDGIIRKVYTVEELAANGYSGYINMQKIIK